MKHIEPNEIIARRRIPSGHGASIEYEFLHAIVNWGQNYDTPMEVVLSRMVYQGIPDHKMPAEIPMEDLEIYQREWNAFVQQSLDDRNSRR
jgi:hypothetical protein